MFYCTYTCYIPCFVAHILVVIHYSLYIYVTCFSHHPLLYRHVGHDRKVRHITYHLISQAHALALYTYNQYINYNSHKYIAYSYIARMRTPVELQIYSLLYTTLMQIKGYKESILVQTRRKQ